MRYKIGDKLKLTDKLDNQFFEVVSVHLGGQRADKTTHYSVIINGRPYWLSEDLLADLTIPINQSPQFFISVDEEEAEEEAEEPEEAEDAKNKKSERGIRRGRPKTHA